MNISGKTTGTISLLIYSSLFVLLACIASVTLPGLMNHTQTSKFIVFAYGIIFILLLFTIRLFFSSGFYIKLGILDTLLGLLFLYIAVNRYILQPTHGFSMGYYELVALAALYLVIRQANVACYPFLLIAVVIGGIIQAVYGNLQLHGFYPSNHSLFSITGSFFNPGPYAGYLASVFPISFGLYLFRQEKPDDSAISDQPPLGSSKLTKQILVKLLTHYIPLVGVLAILLALPGTHSRAAWLAVLASSAGLLIHKYDVPAYVRTHLDNTLKKVSAAAFILILVGAGAVGLYVFKKGSSEGRLLIWKVTMEMIKDKPLFGHGFDRFKAEYMNYQGYYFQQNPDTGEAMVADNVYYAFNELLQFTAESGLIGLSLLCIAGLLIFYPAPAAAAKDKGHVIAKAGLIAILFFALYSYPSQILPIKINCVLLLAIIAKFQKSIFIIDAGRVWLSNSRNRILKYPALLFSCFALVFFSFRLDKLASGFSAWNDALKIYQSGLYRISLTKYREVYPLFEHEGDFLTGYGKALSMANEHKQAIAVLETANLHASTTVIQTALGDSYKAVFDFEKAEEAYATAYNMVPNRFYAKYLLAKLYAETNQREKAVATARELLRKEVKVESTAIREMKAEMAVIIHKSSS